MQLGAHLVVLADQNFAENVKNAHNFEAPSKKMVPYLYLNGLFINVY